MARIPEAELARIKTDISLVRYLEERGHRLKRHGKDYVTTCPFHEDDTPSLVVSPSNNLWHCLGACQTGGSIIDWVMKTERVSFRHAVERLRNQSGVGSWETGAAAPSASRERPPSLAEYRFVGDR